LDIGMKVGQWERTEYQTVILAAFLHDIGKFLGRGDFKILDKGQHPGFSSTFISAHESFFSTIADVPLLKELVQKHHENSRTFPPEYLVQSIEDGHTRTLATLVSKADNLASSERGEASEQYQDYKATPLCSVIERLDRETDIGLRLRFHPIPLPSITANMRPAIFGAEFAKYHPGDMNKLLESFGHSFSKFIKESGNVNPNFDCLSNHLTNLVYTHTWCIPSNTQEEVPDVSLFDHLKTTAAIAACLYQYHLQTNSLDEKFLTMTETPRFLLVAGDISGIQQYIFGITSAAGGVARKLRARSLFIQLCSEVATHKVLHNLKLPLWNLLMNSGGNFYLLVPNLPKVISTLEKIQEEIDRWFMHTMKGELSLNLAWHPFGDDGFKPADKPGSGFGSVVSHVKTILSLKKQQRFAAITQKEGLWRSNNFVMDVSYEGRGACTSCHKFPGEIDAPDGVCADCNRQSEIGAYLPKANCVWFFNSPEAGKLPILGYSVSIGNQPPEGKKPYLAMKLNDTDLSNLSSWPAVSKYMATYVARRDDQVLKFEDIANAADGQKLLGFLKADVDRLGELFIFGLKRKNVSFDTISRQATLSRLLDMFFTGWLESLLNSEFKNCYTVFSGGDDLFLVGPWNEIISLAGRIQADFDEFTANPKLTISVGIVITKPDYPMARAAALVEEELKKSKSSKEKASITILGTTLRWPNWAKVKAEWDFLRPITAEPSRVPSAFFHNMLAFSEMWRRYRCGDIMGLRYHPLLTYNVSRNLDARKMPELYEWTTRILKFPPPEHEQMVLDNLGLIMTLCLYNRRGGEE